MTNFMRVFLGFIAGVAATIILVLYLIAQSQAYKQRVELTNKIVNSLLDDEGGLFNDEEPEPNVVWFDLTTGRGKEVRLHTQMPKEEVRQLLGKPAKTSVHQGYGGKVHEEWEYEKPSKYGGETMDFNVKFVNGLLESVYQY